MTDKIQIATTTHGEGTAIVLTLKPEGQPEFHTTVSGNFDSKEKADKYAQDFCKGLNQVLNEMIMEDRKSLAK